MALLIGIIVFLLFLCSVKNIFYGLLIQNPGDVKAFSASIFDAWIFRSLRSCPFSCLFAYCSDISVPLLPYSHKKPCFPCWKRNLFLLLAFIDLVY